MKILSLIILFALSSLLNAKDSNTLLNLESVSTKGLDKNVAKVFNQTKKFIIHARKDKDLDTEILATQKWCLLLHNYHFYTQAQDCYRFVGMQDKSSAKWPYLYAKVSLEMGQFELANEGLNEIIRRDNNYLPAHFYKIKQAIEGNELALAFELFDAVPNALRLTSSLLNLQGDLYFATENYYIALGFYQQALLLVPNAKSLNYKIGKAYQNLGLMPLAEQYMQLTDETKIKLIDPYYQEVKDTIVGEIPFIIQAKTALVNNDRKQAIKLYKKALEFNPNSETALVNIAVAYFQNKNYDLAIHYLEKVLNLNPEQQKALYNLAILQRMKGDNISALKHLKKLYTIDSKDVEVNQQLASIYYQLQDYSKVLEIAGLQVMQSHLGTQYLKAKSYIQLQQYAKALSWLLEINNNVPNNFNVVLSLAKLYSQVPDDSLRNSDESLKFAQQAMSINSNEQSQWQLIIALDENKLCQELKKHMHEYGESLGTDSTSVYLKLVQLRNQDLNCTFIND